MRERSKALLLFALVFQHVVRTKILNVIPMLIAFGTDARITLCKNLSDTYDRQEKSSTKTLTDIHNRG